VFVKKIVLVGKKGELTAFVLVGHRATIGIEDDGAIHAIDAVQLMKTSGDAQQQIFCRAPG